MTRDEFTELVRKALNKARVLHGPDSFPSPEPEKDEIDKEERDQEFHARRIAAIHDAEQYLEMTPAQLADMIISRHVGGGHGITMTTNDLEDWLVDCEEGVFSDDPEGFKEFINDKIETYFVNPAEENDGLL